MTIVLVVEDDPLFRGLITKILQRMEEFSLLEASSIDLAKKILQKQRAERQPVHVLLTDLRLGDGDGLDLIETLPDISPCTMPILMSGVASPRDIQSALRLGAIDVLIKPFTREALSLALQRAADSANGFRGSFHGMSLADLLQMLHLARRSLILEIRGHKLRGLVAIEEGEMVHAEAGPHKGMEALQQFLNLKVGSIATFPFRKTEHTLQGDFQNLLLDAFREIDEQNKAPAPSYPEISDHLLGESFEDLPELELLPVDEETPLESIAPPPLNSEQDALVGFVASLDPELGAARLSPSLPVLLAGGLSPQQWKQVSQQAAWLASKISGDWSQYLWVVGDLGLALLNWPGEAPILLAQHFTGALDDRRFRWNISCVAGFLFGELSQGLAS